MVMLESGNVNVGDDVVVINKGGKRLGKLESIHEGKLNVRIVTDNELESLTVKDIEVASDDVKKKYYDARTRKEIELEIERLQKLLDSKEPLTDRQLKEKEEREKINKQREAEDQEAEIKLRNATAQKIEDEEREKKVTERLKKEKEDRIKELQAELDASKAN
jgi:hypothetical protein